MRLLWSLDYFLLLFYYFLILFTTFSLEITKIIKNKTLREGLLQAADLAGGVDGVIGNARQIQRRGSDERLRRVVLETDAFAAPLGEMNGASAGLDSCKDNESSC